MLFTQAPSQSYHSEDGHRLRWRGYRDNDKRALFGCTCFEYVEAGFCEHSQEITELYQFVARYWPDAGSTFWRHLYYYQSERAKIIAREEGHGSHSKDALTTANGQGV